MILIFSYLTALEKTSTNLQDRFDRGIQSLQDAMETHFAGLANMIKTLDDRVERVENIISDSQDDSSNKFTAMQNMVSEVKHAQSMMGAGLQPPQEDSPATKTTKTQTDDEDIGAKRMATQTDDIEIRDITGYKSMGLQTEEHLLEPLNGNPPISLKSSCLNTKFSIFPGTLRPVPTRLIYSRSTRISRFPSSDSISRRLWRVGQQLWRVGQ